MTARGQKENAETMRNSLFSLCGFGKLYQMGFCCAYKKTLKNIKKGVDFVFWKWYYIIVKGS